jgi:hypothetical protein
MLLFSCDAVSDCVVVLVVPAVSVALPDVSVVLAADEVVTAESVPAGAVSVAVVSALAQARNENIKTG